MNNTKLVQLMKSLSATELHKLQQFVSAPFINTNENIISLFSCISKHHPDYKNPLLEKKKVFAKLFPNETYNDGRIRYLSSELLSIAENFLVYTTLVNDRVDKQIRLLHELN